MPIKEASIFPVFQVIKEASKINRTKFKQALNESLNIDDNQNKLYLTPLLSGMMRRTESKATFEGAAQHFGKCSLSR